MTKAEEQAASRTVTSKEMRRPNLLGVQEQPQVSEFAAGDACAVEDFQLMDRNGDGGISAGELNLYFQGHLGMGKEEAGSVADGVLLGADADGDGQLTCEDLAIVFNGDLAD